MSCRSASAGRSTTSSTWSTARYSSPRSSPSSRAATRKEVASFRSRPISRHRPERSARTVKNAKAVTGRLAYSPVLGHEIAGSFYHGRYTPDSLPSEDINAFGVDGLSIWGPFELEGEYIHSDFGDVDAVARGFAAATVDQEASSTVDNFETKIAFGLDALADTRDGYWIEPAPLSARLAQALNLRPLVRRPGAHRGAALGAGVARRAAAGSRVHRRPSDGAARKSTAASIASRSAVRTGRCRSWLSSSRTNTPGPIMGRSLR